MIQCLEDGLVCHQQITFVPCLYLCFMAYLLIVFSAILIFFHFGISFGLTHGLCGCHWIMQVTSHIVKLVLRNNAMTTLHGIEHLKSLEGLDASYNVISNFEELEVLAGLPSLLSLWLEGNPICSARWYRAQVFSLFTYPDKVSPSL